jgi:hypothetical protein
VFDQCVTIGRIRHGIRDRSSGPNVCREVIERDQCITATIDSDQASDLVQPLGGEGQVKIAAIETIRR